jgi:hypothetical protein
MQRTGKNVTMRGLTPENITISYEIQATIKVTSKISKQAGYELNLTPGVAILAKQLGLNLTGIISKNDAKSWSPGGDVWLIKPTKGSCKLCCKSLLKKEQGK